MTSEVTSPKPEGWDSRIKHIEGCVHSDLKALAEKESWSEQELRLATRYAIALVRPNAAARLKSARTALTNANRSIAKKVETVFINRIYGQLPAMPGLQELQFVQSVSPFGPARLEAVAQKALELLRKADVYGGSSGSGYELVKLTITHYATVLPELAPDARLKIAFELALRDRTGNPMTAAAVGWARWKAGKLLTEANANL